MAVSEWNSLSQARVCDAFAVVHCFILSLISYCFSNPADAQRYTECYFMKTDGKKESLD